MTSFKLKINKYINENENLKQFFNEFAKVINNQKDIFILKKLAMENDCKDLMDILCIKRLYHLYFSQYFKDKRVNYTQKNSTSSLFIFFFAKHYNGIKSLSRFNKIWHYGLWSFRSRVL
jgi:hypothetical protein